MKSKSYTYSVVSEGCFMNADGCRGNCNKQLGSSDWLCDLPETRKDCDYVEVQFKNTRKGYYLNSTHLSLEKGDMVVVESSPGHDIGEVTLVGRLVWLQMKKYNFDPQKVEVRRVYRKLKDTDFVKLKEAKAKEHETMIQARKIAENLKLDMKIGDVEYQGDGLKAIFYYIADERVDFRQLIKVFAETFRVRIEMKQIGARQEAGRIGGIGPCGRPLCCSCWMTGFNSVSTVAARYQDISLSPQKLAGQCGKLKCCMNFELDTYMEALKDIPSREVQLETQDNTYYHFKTDVFKRLMTYSTDRHNAVNLVTLTVERVKDLIAMNRAGTRPEKLLDAAKVEQTVEQNPDYENIVGQDSLTRFDKNRHRNHKPKLVKKTDIVVENNTEKSSEKLIQKSENQGRDSLSRQKDFRRSNNNRASHHNSGGNNGFHPRNNNKRTDNES